jgi:hypothetical protein
MLSSSANAASKLSGRENLTGSAGFVMINTFCHGVVMHRGQTTKITQQAGSGQLNTRNFPSNMAS